MFLQNIKICLVFLFCNLLLHRFVSTNLPLAVQELDENQIGKFSFQSNDAVLQVISNSCFHVCNKPYICFVWANVFILQQLMNQSSLENLQVVLVCQVVQKNALIGAVKQASVCHWAETFDPSSHFTVQLIQHDRSTASEKQRRDLTVKQRLSFIFNVSVWRFHPKIQRNKRKKKKEKRYLRDFRFVLILFVKRINHINLVNTSYAFSFCYTLRVYRWRRTVCCF